MSWLVSPYSEVRAHARALELREKAAHIENGSIGECSHPADKVVFTQSVNTSADNNLGTQTTINVICGLCDSVVSVTHNTPACKKCSDFTSEEGIVWMVTAGPNPKRHSRDYNQTYPCVCPKCNNVQNVELQSIYD